MRIQHNIAALNSYRNLTNNNSAVSKNLEKLSSGYRINRAGDDAAGLAISEKMRAQITGLNTAQKNAQDGVSLVQTAEGALTEVHSMLNRMVELADQSANGTYDDKVDRENLQKEITSLKDEIDRIADSTNFNGINLLDGSLQDGATIAVTVSGKGVTANGDGTFKLETGKLSNGDTITINGKSYVYDAAGDGNNGKFNEYGELVTLAAKDGLTIGGGDFNKITATKAGKELTLQIGDTSADFNQMTVGVNDMHTAALGIDKIDISTQQGAKDAVDLIKNAINSVSSTRGDLGAIQNRLEHTINNLSVTAENMTAAESRIRDVDMANEMMAYTKNNILVQSSQAMLAQANQIPQGVLQLLQ